MDQLDIIANARKVLKDSLIYFNGEPVGCVAAKDPNLFASNYEECFVRDFIPVALVFLSEGEHEIVRRFLSVIADIRGQETVMTGHARSEGIMPASFRVVEDKGRQIVVADFGDKAIGRVAPVDSAMWWMILLNIYLRISGDTAFVHSSPIQQTIIAILKLYLKDNFETLPAMLVPDASFMIDRRMGVYGHPLEIQALFYGMLLSAEQLLVDSGKQQWLKELLIKRLRSLRSFLRIFYWLDLKRLNEIHRFKSEEIGLEVNNLLNIYPESIPEWINGWFPSDAGYFVGNLGPGRMDFRFFSLGNLLAVVFDLATEEQASKIMNLFEVKRQELIGEMPVIICYPAVSGEEWALLTGCDPKNVAWSYHNAGHWPCLLWAFIAAALHTNRKAMADDVFNIALKCIQRDQWPEYYDGKNGFLVGRRANLFQTWTAAAIVLGHQLLNGENDCKKVFSAIKNLGMSVNDKP